jgi:hypothetical protein
MKKIPRYNLMKINYSRKIIELTEDILEQIVRKDPQHKSSLMRQLLLALMTYIFINGFLSVSANSCVPGKFSCNNCTICTQCPPGSFSNNTGAISCSLCPQGSYSPLPGAISCIICPYTLWSGAAACNPGSMIVRCH